MQRVDEELMTGIDALAEAADVASRWDGADARSIVVEGSRGGFDIEVSEDAGEIRIDLGGAVYTLERGDTPEDWEEARALAMDMVGAALFGVVTLTRETFRDGEVRSATAVYRDRHGHSHTLAQSGRGGLNPFTKRRAVALQNDYERPEGFERVAFEGLPWAPWAGECGYCGAQSWDEPGEIAVDGELDLHPFHPKEVKPLVLAYIEACQDKGIRQLRIVHGKGKGVLRRTVHSLLDKHPSVAHYELGGMGGGSWGATVVDLVVPTGDDGPS